MSIIYIDITMRLDNLYIFTNTQLNCWIAKSEAFKHSFKNYMLEIYLTTLYCEDKYIFAGMDVMSH
jgi:hypothetical protein